MAFLSWSIPRMMRRHLASRSSRAFSVRPTAFSPPRDPHRDPPDAEFLRWVGAATYSAYAKGVRSVDVWARGNTGLPFVEVTPMANGGARTGFTPMDEMEELHSPEPSELGAAVQRALTIATA